MTAPQSNPPESAADGDPSTHAQPRGAGPLRPTTDTARDVDLMHARLEVLREEIRSQGRYLVILAVVAAVACLTTFAGLGKASAATERAREATRELRALQAQFKKLPSQAAPPPRRVIPVAGPSELRPSEDRTNETVLRELGRLQRLVGSSPAQQAEVEAGFLAWGQEVRQYVDDAIAQAATTHRTERTEELRPVFQRLLEIEARLQVR